MKKNLGMLMSAALALTLLLSSCSSPTEEETNVKSIVTRLNEATGFDWAGTPAIDDDQSETEAKFWDSVGFIQDLGPSDQRECVIRVFVFENDEFAKKGKNSPYFDLDDNSIGFAWVFEDPETKYGIILLGYDNPCKDDAASAFEYVLPPRS